jgi:glycosyltransferase involved in cell wall biosynthesis
MVGDGETGRLVPVNDPPALAGAIVELLADPDRRRAMGEAARQKVAARFSREAMVAGMVAVYEKVLTGR